MRSREHSQKQVTQFRQRKQRGRRFRRRDVAVFLPRFREDEPGIGRKKCVDGTSGTLEVVDRSNIAALP